MAFATTVHATRNWVRMIDLKSERADIMIGIGHCARSLCGHFVIVQ